MTTNRLKVEQGQVWGVLTQDHVVSGAKRRAATT